MRDEEILKDFIAIHKSLLAKDDFTPVGLSMKPYPLCVQNLIKDHFQKYYALDAKGRFIYRASLLNFPLTGVAKRNALSKSCAEVTGISYCQKCLKRTLHNIAFQPRSPKARYLPIYCQLCLHKINEKCECLHCLRIKENLVEKIREVTNLAYSSEVANAISGVVTGIEETVSDTFRQLVHSIELRLGRNVYSVRIEHFEEINDANLR